jgi:hypothetical protein
MKPYRDQTHKQGAHSRSYDASDKRGFNLYSTLIHAYTYRTKKWKARVFFTSMKNAISS